MSRINYKELAIDPERIYIDYEKLGLDPERDELIWEDYKNGCCPACGSDKIDEALYYPLEYVFAERDGGIYKYNCRDCRKCFFVLMEIVKRYVRHTLAVGKIAEKEGPK